MTIQTTAKQAKRIAKKAAAYYATYEATKKTANKALDKYARVMQFDSDYSYAEFEAAEQIATEGAVRLPMGGTDYAASRAGGDEGAFRENKWTTIRLKGASLALQARFSSYGEISFRSPLPRDLRVLADRIAEIREGEPEKPKLTFDLDIEPTTVIIGWDKEDKMWTPRNERSSRSFSSVFLPVELQEEIEADLRRYTDSAKRLRRLELPWRRGYLLSGPPGTGKTSMALAIAGVLGFQLASLSLTDIDSDGELRDAISKLRKRTVLVIEDIDAYSISHDRDHNTAKDGALSLSGLLNSLDGFETPDGLVTIATTNHVEHLDPALVRSGRLDRTFTLDYIEAPEIERLFAWFYEQEAPGKAPNASQAHVAPAEVMELFKQHLDDPTGGWAAMHQRVTGKALAVVNNNFPLAA